MLQGLQTGACFVAVRNLKAGDPGIHPIGSVCMEQSELDDAIKLGKREDYTGELLEEIPE